MKLGILVVYLVSDESKWIFDAHLRHLSTTAPFMNYNLYAAANRLPAKYHDVLRQHPFIKIIELPNIEERSSAEHGMYLDILVSHAISDGCDFVCTFDVDSWPIRSDWIEIAYNMLQQSGAAAAAVLRAENGDTVLPHPLFSFLESSLFLSNHCKFWLTEAVGGKEFLQFLSDNRQHGDTGSGIGFSLYKSRKDWVRILRSNKKDLHYLMGGIYGGLIFHMGASSRSDLVFRGDDVKWIIDLVAPIARLPVIWRYKPYILDFMKRSYVPAAMRRNKKAFDCIAAKLNEDEYRFYEELRGNG